MPEQRMHRHFARQTPELGRGPRLFAGDYYDVMKKHGALTAALQHALAIEPMVFTVTGTSKGRGSTFVRIHYQCPVGVFVQTRRSQDLEDSGVVLRTTAHRHLTISRKIGESFIVRSKKGVRSRGGDGSDAAEYSHSGRGKGKPE